MLFYAAWPLGYHNVEAERKAVGFAEAGFDVVYVAGVGTRNPGLASMAKVRDRARRKAGRRSSSGTGHAPGLREAGVLVAPPRQVSAVRRLNVAWLTRQLRAAVPDWDRAVAWIRWPTPELVDALARLRPAVAVYECVDAYHHTPGITGRWAAVHENAERALVALADVVVVPGDVLAERFRSWGAEVRVVPHGVGPLRWRPPRPERTRAPVAGFVGTLDYRLDTDVLRTAALCLPDWRFRLVGPVQEGFDPAAFDALENLAVEPPVGHDRLGDLLADFDVGILAYRDDPVCRAMTPLKNLELLAAGRPCVTRPLPGLEPYRDVLYFATSAEGFVTQLRRAVEEDSEERAAHRRSVVEGDAWEHRVAELNTLVAALLARR
jgi:glycosyltransferase involved in cell wall biosynthesis